MKLRKEEFKKQGNAEAEVSKVTEEDIVKAFGVTMDHMLEAAKILQAEENTKIQEALQHDYIAIMDPQTIVKVWTRIKRYYSFK